jgi:hypothetical protein
MDCTSNCICIQLYLNYLCMCKIVHTCDRKLVPFGVVHVSSGSCWMETMLHHSDGDHTAIPIIIEGQLNSVSGFLTVFQL